MTDAAPAARTPDMAARLAAFAAELRWDDIPAQVRERAVHHILDATGIALAASRFDFAQRTLTAMQALGGAGEVPVIGLPAALSPRDAAVVNGLLCHGLDFDDTHLGGVVHPTCSAFPCALSAGLMTGASGRDVVLAYILGVEVAAARGTGANGGFHQVGFHPTGVAGAFACTLVAGRLMGLSSPALKSAQGIALSMAGGSLEFLEDGAWNKRLHPGHAAAVGITAAALAESGFVGIDRPYSGRFGLYNAYLGAEAGRQDLAKGVAGLGETWELLNTAIKPYPACHFTHGCIDAALALSEAGADPEEVTEIVARVPGEVVKTICEPEANKKAPANSYDAQFSVHYLVAAALLRGRLTLAELEDGALADPAIRALTRKVRYEVDPDSGFPRHYSGEVILRRRDGSERRQRQAVNRGAPDRPLSDAEIVEKYRANALTAIGGARAERIRADILALGEAADLLPVAAALDFAFH